MDYKKIKSYEDACADQGKDPAALPDYSKCGLSAREEKFNLAAFKLSRIAVSLNKQKGKVWTPGPDDRRYYPWMWWKEDATRASGSGLSFFACVGGRSFSDVASRLTFRTSDIATYAFEQFRDLYEDMIIF